MDEQYRKSSKISENSLGTTAKPNPRMKHSNELESQES